MIFRLSLHDRMCYNLRGYAMDSSICTIETGVDHSPFATPAIIMSEVASIVVRLFVKENFYLNH